jgi:hypothetical protein
MASHRRGLRPSQWPVRDLLGPDVAPGRLWDARIGAALAGLLACGAAVTVVLTSGDQAVSDPTAEALGPGPQAGPPSGIVVPAPSVPVPQVPALQVPPPAIALPQLVPAPAGPMVVTPPAVTVPRITPPRSARPHHAAPPRMRQGSTGSASRSKEQTLAEQVASAVEHREDRPARHRADVGRLRVPAQRPADAAALLNLACPDEDRSEGHRSGGRHRVPDSEVEHHLARHHHAHRDHDDRDHRERDHAEHEHDDDRSGWSWFETADDDDRPEWSWFETDRDSDEDDGHRTGAHGDERNDEVDEDAVSDRDDAEERDDDAGEDGAEGVADSE